MEEDRAGGPHCDAERCAWQIRSAEPGERQALIESYLLLQVSAMAGLPRSEIDPEASLRELGLDSLRATDLMQWIEQDLRVAVPVVDLLKGPSPRRLAEQIARALSGAGTAQKEALAVPPSTPRPFGRADEPRRAASASDGGVRLAPAALDDPTILWFRRRARSSEARLRLFCFPYGGGGDSVYRTWGDSLSQRIEVCPVKLPGREDRLEEAPFESLPLLIEALERAILPLLDRPFAFLGISMGGIIGFELARRLRSAHGLSPAHLFAVASPAPHEVHRATTRMIDAMGRPGSDIDSEGAYRIGMRPEHVVARQDVAQVLLVALKADFRMMAAYDCREEDGPLDCDISVFGGVQDRLVDRDILAGWSRHTQGDFTLRMLPGDHFFVESERASVLHGIAQDLAHYVEVDTRGARP
jgi:surfactin synthase thioesterase subunit/acyl carrier protein